MPHIVNDQKEHVTQEMKTKVIHYYLENYILEQKRMLVKHL